MTPDQDGGVVIKNMITSKVNDVDKSSLLVVPVDGIRKVLTFTADNMDKFTQTLLNEKGTSKLRKVSVNLRRSDNKLSKELISIDQFEDVEMNNLERKSNVLNQQKIELSFLASFIEEWQKNPAFKDQFQEILEDQVRREQMIKLLKELRQSLDENKRPEPILSFLNNI